jgi:PPOX class probable F420-dependent enzyme
VSELPALPRWALVLLESARVARLGLLDDDDRPRVLPVTFALAEGALWSAIDHKPKGAGEPARVRYLQRRPQAALTADRYDDDWTRLAWVQVLGEVALLDAEAAAGGLEALAAKYVQYRERAPAGPLLRLEPSRVLFWRAHEDEDGAAERDRARR